MIAETFLKVTQYVSFEVACLVELACRAIGLRVGSSKQVESSFGFGAKSEGNPKRQ